MGLRDFAEGLLKKYNDAQGLPPATQSASLEGETSKDVRYDTNHEQTKKVKSMIIQAFMSGPYDRVGLQKYSGLLDRVAVAYTTWIWGSARKGVGVFDFTRQSAIARAIDNGQVLKYYGHDVQPFGLVIPSDHSKIIENVMKQLEAEYIRGESASL